VIVPAVTTWEVSGRKQIRIEGFETIELIGMEGDAVKAKIIGTAETTEYSYDNNGNLTSIKDPKGITTLEYDYENRLTKFTKPDGSWARFTYDPFGRRYSKETSTGEKEIYLYDGLHILEIYDGNTMQLKSSFIHSDIIDEVLFGNIQGQDLYYHQDGLNSVKALTDGVGNVVTSYDYDAWGNPVGSLPAIMNPFTFTGREWDKETGLYYYRARYYDAKVGRFVSKDPIGLAGGDINLYSYVSNNPVNFVDPYGLQTGALATGWGIALAEPSPVGEVIMTGITMGVIGYEIYSRARGKSDPYTLPTVNPGRDCDGKCKPCPPNEHTHAGGTGSRHQIIYRQDPKTCTCYPERIHL